MDTSAELRIVSDVERQLEGLRLSSRILSEHRIAPLRGIADLVRLKLALRRFAEIHRFKRSQVLNPRDNGTRSPTGRCRVRSQR